MVGKHDRLRVMRTWQLALNLPIAISHQRYVSPARKSVTAGRKPLFRLPTAALAGFERQSLYLKQLSTRHGASSVDLLFGPGG